MSNQPEPDNIDIDLEEVLGHLSEDGAREWEAACNRAMVAKLRAENARLQGLLEQADPRFKPGVRSALPEPEETPAIPLKG